MSKRVRAELKSIFCWDFPMRDLETWVPETQDFGFNIVLFVGMQGSEGCDSFDAFACTPGYLAGYLTEGQVVCGQYVFLVGSFNYHHLKRCVEEYVNRCDGDSWREIGKKLSHIGAWEFDDFDTRIMPRFSPL